MKKQNKHTFPERKPNHLLILDKFKAPMKIFNQQQEIDSLFTFCYERTQQLRKNQIKVSKNKLPSDFFKTNKPETVSSSYNQRINKRETMTSPNKNKKQLNSSQAATTYDQNIKDQDIFQTKLANNFKNEAIQFSSQNHICFTDRKYKCQNYEQSKQKSSFKQIIRGHRRQKSLGKPPFFDCQKPTSQKIQIQFPSIKSATITNSLCKRIQSNKMNFVNNCCDYKNFSNIKLSAVMANSRTPNQTNTIYYSQIQKSKNRSKNTLQSTYNQDQMMITFCNLNKTSHFFQQ